MKQLPLLLDTFGSASSRTQRKDAALKSKSLTDSEVFDIDIIRSKRRSLSLSVKNGRVCIRAPMRAPRYTINEFVENNTSWINKQIVIERRQLAERLSISNGQSLTVLGKPYIVHIHQRSTPNAAKHNHTASGRKKHQSRITVSDNRINIDVSTAIDTIKDKSCEDLITPAAHNAFLKWLPSFIADTFYQQTTATAKKIAVEHKLTKITFRRTRSKWGHCTSTGAIQYNPLIALAPKFVIDYIVCHEVCHLTHPNHSRQFWSLVESIYGEYKTPEQWLRDHGHRIALELL